MDIYDMSEDSCTYLDRRCDRLLRIGVVPSRTEIALEMTREETKRPTRLRGAVAWLQSGLKIEEKRFDSLAFLFNAAS